MVSSSSVRFATQEPLWLRQALLFHAVPAFGAVPSAVLTRRSCGPAAPAAQLCVRGLFMHCLLKYVTVIILSTAGDLARANGLPDLIGVSEHYRVTISNGLHPFKESRITVERINSEGSGYSEGIENVPFSTQCYSTKSTIICHMNSKTPLSGATYRLTLDATPVCPGSKVEYRYTCVKGCKKDTPRYLKIQPYEC